MDPYATHLEATVTAALQSGLLWPGSMVLELGCGDYSTPVLAAIAAAQERPYLCLASDRAWLDRYDVPKGLVTDWESQEFPECGFALLDSEEFVINRVRRLPALANRARVVVMHDARADIDWPLIWRSFAYLAVMDDPVPSTLIASNHVNPADWWRYRRQAA